LSNKFDGTIEYRHPNTKLTKIHRIDSRIQKSIEINKWIYKKINNCYRHFIKFATKYKNIAPQRIIQFN